MGLYEKYEDIGDEHLNFCMFFGPVSPDKMRK